MAPKALQSRLNAERRNAPTEHDARTGRFHGVLSPARRSFPKTGGVSDADWFGPAPRDLHQRVRALDVRLRKEHGALREHHHVAAHDGPIALVIPVAAQQRRAAHLDPLVDLPEL